MDWQAEHRPPADHAEAFANTPIENGFGRNWK